ncbi:MAG: cytochrome b5 domain-containing protein [Patescibacteria group bacterium]|jgi:cytochrome b involved in lipid metabolism
MKKLVTISLFVFGVIVTAILTASLIYYQGNKPGNNTGSSQTSPAVSLPLTEITKHNLTSDCWLLINNKVYNVTSYLSTHPGGAGTIIPSCGQEATQAFNTKDIGRPHSKRATAMLADYYIGDLSQQTMPQ